MSSTHPSSSNRKAAFTIVELMIVVAIVLVLAAIAIPLFVVYQSRARQSEVATVVDGIRVSEVAYEGASGWYAWSGHPYPDVYYWRGDERPWGDPFANQFDLLDYRPDGAVRGTYTVIKNVAFVSDWVTQEYIAIGRVTQPRIADAARMGSQTWECAGDVDEFYCGNHADTGLLSDYKAACVTGAPSAPLGTCMPWTP